MSKCTISSRVILLAMLPIGSGCGLAFVSGPPPKHEILEHFACTESKVLPKLDLAGAALGAIALGDVSQNPDDYVNPAQLKAVAIGWVALAILSNAVGEKKVNDCTAAKLRLAERADKTEASNLRSNR